MYIHSETQTIYVCTNIFTVHYRLDKIKQTSDAQYKIVVILILYLLTYLVTLVLASSNTGLENFGLKPIPV